MSESVLVWMSLGWLFGLAAIATKVWVISPMLERMRRRRRDRRAEEWRKRADAARAKRARTPRPCHYRSCDDCGHEWYGRSGICPECGGRHCGLEVTSREEEERW